MAGSAHDAPEFLTAAWRHLVMVNWAVPPEVLQPHVPAGCELDLFEGRALVTIVGFRFLDTRVLGVPIPLHRNFTEINLRFYCRREGPTPPGAAGDVEERKGVVFLREVVSLPAVSWIARAVYQENYVTRRTRCEVRPPEAGGTGVFDYRWRHDGAWCGVRAEPAGDPRPLVEGSEEHFVAEHYWGWAARRDGGTIEYRVEHPPWRVWPGAGAAVVGDVAGFCAETLPAAADAFAAEPVSTVVAEGSEVRVRRGVRLPPDAPVR